MARARGTVSVNCSGGRSARPSGGDLGREWPGRTWPGLAEHLGLTTFDRPEGRNSRGSGVAVSAEGEKRGPLDPLPHVRRSNTASRAWMTVPAAVLTW